MKYFLIFLMFSIPAIAAEKSADGASKKNRIRYIIGAGPDGYKVTQTPKVVNVSKDTTGVIGVGYERKLDEVISIGGEALSNGTFLFTIGVDF